MKYDETLDQLTMDYGIGHWNLYPKKDRVDEFSAEGEGLLNVIYDLRTIKFRPTGSDITKMEMISFQGSPVPIFNKQMIH